MTRLLTLAALLCPSIAAAWNGPGHQTVDLVAWQLLEDDDQARAVALLRDHPRFDQHFLESMPPAVWKGSPAERDQWCFAHAGTWPDQVRPPRGSVTREDVREFNQPGWHYVNLPVFLSRDDRQLLGPTLTNNRETEPPADPADDGQNVAQAIASSLAVLSDDSRPRADRAVSLCWFLHLAGDAHQPMHSAALFTPSRFPKGDRGGNSIPVRGAEGNLHGLWDASILPRRTDYNRVRREALELVDQHADDGRKAARELTPKAWLVESWRLAESQAYAPEIREAVAAAENGGELERIQLPPDYLRAAGLASKRRAAEAGFRIAAALRGHLPASEGVQEPLEKPAAVDQESEPAETTAPPLAVTEARYWLNTGTNVRHNASCRNFEKTAAGRYCGPDDGKACGICGG